jgi:3D (Asp-Asp-Asp) domain-containing protein
MLKTIKTLIAVAALSGTVSANVQAATVTPQKGISPWEQVNNMVISAERPNNAKLGDTLWNKFQNSNVDILQMTNWNQSITALIHPSLNLSSFDDQSIVVNPQPAATVTSPVLASEVIKPASAPVKVAAAPVVTKSSPAPVIAPVASKPVPVNAAKVEVTATPDTTVKSSAPAPAAPVAADTKPAPAETSTATKESSPAPAAAPAPDTSSKEITVKATAYTASCEGCSGVTATGVNIKDNPDKKVIAVDPKVIPLGSKVYVEGFGEATAADTGGAIKGNRIDVFIPTEQAALKFGVKHLKVTILN